MPKTFRDNTAYVQTLIDAAAEYLYGESEPGLFAKYLNDKNRPDETIAFAKTHLPLVSIEEQPYLLNYWGNAILTKAAPNANAEALPFYREAVRIKPDYWVGYNNLMLGLVNLGEVEELIKTGQLMATVAGGRPGKASEDMYQIYDNAVYNLRASRAAGITDMAGTGGTVTTQSGAEGCTAVRFMPPVDWGMRRMF